MAIKVSSSSVSFKSITIFFGHNITWTMVLVYEQGQEKSETLFGTPEMRAAVPKVKYIFA